MFNLDENDPYSGANPLPIDVPSVNPLTPPSQGGEADKIKADQDAAAKKKAYLGVLGNIFQGLSDTPSGYEIYTKSKSQRPDIKGMFGAVSDSVQNPMDQQQKAFAYLKAKRDNTAATDKDTFLQGLKDDTGAAAKAYKQMFISKGMDPSTVNGMKAYDMAVQGFNPAKMAEIQAESAIQHANRIDEISAGKNADMAKMREEQRLKNAEREKEIGLKKGEGQTEGRKALDRDFAKEYTDWTGHGRGEVDKNLQRLQDAYEDLGTDHSLTGGFRGSLPDAVRNVTNEKAVTTRDNVRAAAQGALKATLGAQFTEREGERIMNQAYNERLSPEANRAKIQAAIAELKAKRDTMEGMSRHFERNGTLTGYSAAPNTRTVRMQAPDGSIRDVPADQVDDALASGGKRLDSTAGN